MTGILPHITFLIGSDNPTRYRFAGHIADLHRGKAMSYMTPIEDGLCGTFFEGDPGINIYTMHDIEVIPNHITYGALGRQYVDFLEWHVAKDILAQLLIKRIEEAESYYDRFIVCDARDKDDVRPVADYFGREHCLIVNIETGTVPPANYLTSKTIKCITIPSASPESMLESLLTSPSLGASSDDDTHTSAA